jgi:hypothetical protein
MPRSYEEHLVTDISKHAAEEAMAALIRVTEAAPPHLVARAMISSFAKVTISISRTLVGLPSVRNLYLQEVLELKDWAREDNDE